MEHVDDIFWAAFNKPGFTYDLDEEESLGRLDALTRNMALDGVSASAHPLVEKRVNCLEAYMNVA